MPSYNVFVTRKFLYPKINANKKEDAEAIGARRSEENAIKGCYKVEIVAKRDRSQRKP